MFHLLQLQGLTILLEGNSDLESLWLEYQAKILEELGPEPSVLSYREQGEYAAKRITLLRRYQRIYELGGNFETIFIESLIRDHGFKKHDHSTVRLV